jgi:hypothetical protein
VYPDKIVLFIVEVTLYLDDVYVAVATKTMEPADKRGSKRWGGKNCVIRVKIK